MPPAVNNPDIYPIFDKIKPYRLQSCRILYLALEEISLKPDADWKAAPEKSLPSGLQVKIKANGNGKLNINKDIVTIGRLF